MSHPDPDLIIRLVAATKGIKELSRLIDTYLVPQDLEKKQNAEVSTPHALRQEMLDKVPVDFWSAPRKVFEPCCGKGGFVIDIIDRFMDGLKDAIPDDEERYRVIVEECVYFADINPTNVFVTRLLVDPLGRHRLNVFEGDTLKIDTTAAFGVDAFDAVIGNPPYNDNSGNKGKGHTLWTVFVQKALDKWLAEGGYLVYVHPSLWRQVDHPLLLQIQKYQMLYLDINDEKDGMRVFKCNTRFDWYVLQKRESSEPTTVVDQDGEVCLMDLRQWRFLPNCRYDLISCLLATDDGKPCHLIQDRSAYGSDKKWISRDRTSQCIHPVVYSVNRKNVLTLLWSCLNDKGHFGVPKVIYGW
jgi:hypothetical protein